MEKGRRLRLMHVVFSLETGGLENGVVNLCNGLDRDLFATSVCVFRAGGALASRLDTAEVELTLVRRYLNTDPSLPVRLAWELRRQRVDIIHTHSWGTLVEGVLAAKLARTPVVIHGEHGVMEERPRNIPVQRYLWSKANQLTAVADSLADRMVEVVGAARNEIQVIPNGVDSARFRPLPAEQDECRRQFGLPTTGLLLGMVARLVPVKNHLGVFRAVAQLKDHGIGVQLALAGDGPLREDLRQAATGLGIADRVYFLGNVVRVERLLPALDVFVLNSHTEGMSNTILEAMSCGVPVVATAVGSTPAIIADGRSGCLIPAGDVAALVRALDNLARDPLLRRNMGQTGRMQIEHGFSIDRMVRDYQELYLRKASVLLASRSAGPDRNRRSSSAEQPAKELI